MSLILFQTGFKKRKLVLERKFRILVVYTPTGIAHFKYNEF